MQISSPVPVLAYSPQGAALASSLSIRKIREAIATGELRSRKKGRRRIILAGDLNRYLRK